jgi:hypothetical protein
MTYVFDFFKRRNTPHMTPDLIETLFADAGFKNIEIVEKLIDIGGWRGGSSVYD